MRAPSQELAWLHTYRRVDAIVEERGAETHQQRTLPKLPGADAPVDKCSVIHHVRRG
jgi:hypothetical protein